jgi:ABC-type uncharacterized transport system ATPase subunit
VDLTMADRVLEVDRLSKRYGDVVALQDLSFHVRAGELFGFVGSNGAGKTTTMRIAMGVLTADAGEVRWGGAPLTFETRRHIGYMPEQPMAQKERSIRIEQGSVLGNRRQQASYFFSVADVVLSAGGMLSSPNSNK